MGISFENLFMPNKSIQNMQTGGVQSGSQPVNSAVNQLLQNMFSQGDVISGKVSSLQGNVVELLLPSGQSLSAVLGQNVPVNLGEQMIFSVMIKIHHVARPSVIATRRIKINRFFQAILAYFLFNIFFCSFLSSQ